jgi:hypothetical protein
MITNGSNLKISGYALGAALVMLTSFSPPVGAFEIAEPGAESKGEIIYVGSTYPLNGESVSPLFTYERRVSGIGDQLVSTHVTRYRSGEVAISESANHTADYALLDYSLERDQAGQSGSIHVQNGTITFRFGRGGEEKVKSEKQSGPVAVGPTLVGFIYRNLDALRSGREVKVRLAVLDRLETIGFKLKSMEAAPGMTRICMSASNFLVAMAVDPVLFTFDTATGKLVRIEGRVPPKLKDGKDWKYFDARVEYQFLAATYK